MEHRIAIISDTHSLLRPEIKEILQSCEVILHSGDIASQKTVEEIKSITTTYFVKGNADKNVEEDIPEQLEIALYGFHFYMVHNKKYRKENLNEVDIFIYGHSHKYEEIKKGGTLYLNPGSCGPRRFRQPITMAVMTIEDETHSYWIEKIDCSSGVKEVAEPKISEKDMDKLIKAIVKDMNMGRDVETIAKRNQVEVEFVNQILQIYTTHPGIDVDGILNRMDIWRK